MPAISVIVAAHDAEATLPATLDALAAQDIDDYEVIVVDDASTDGTAAAARAHPEFTLVAGEGSGPGPARQLGVEHSSGALLAFTDADCIPRPDWLRRGASAAESAELVQGAVRPAAEPRRHPFDRTVSIAAFTGLFECANLFVSRTAFDAAGGFEDWLPARIGKPLAEDVWLGWRVVRAGASTTFEPAAIVEHAVFRRGFRDFVKERSRLAYFPPIVAKMPELRRFMFARWFLTLRTAAFDAAAAGVIAAAALGSPIPLALLAPYAYLSFAGALPWRRHAPAALAGGIAADAVGLGALLAGSARARTLLV